MPRFTISADAEVGPDASAEVFERDADCILRAFVSALPQGTLDRLHARLSWHRATGLTISSRGWERSRLGGVDSSTAARQSLAFDNVAWYAEGNCGSVVSASLRMLLSSVEHGHALLPTARATLDRLCRNSPIRLSVADDVVVLLTQVDRAGHLDRLEGAARMFSALGDDRSVIVASALRRIIPVLGGDGVSSAGLFAALRAARLVEEVIDRHVSDVDSPEVRDIVGQLLSSEEPIVGSLRWAVAEVALSVQHHAVSADSLDSLVSQLEACARAHGEGARRMDELKNPAGAAELRRVENLLWAILRCDGRPGSWSLVRDPSPPDPPEGLPSGDLWDGG